MGERRRALRNPSDDRAFRPRQRAFYRGGQRAARLERSLTPCQRSRVAAIVAGRRRGAEGMASDSGGEVRWKLWAEAFRTWTPLLISICAISLTIFQAASTRRHARLSVQPRVDFRLTEDATGAVEIAMVNVGFGPAIVTEVTLEHGETDLGQVDVDACQDLDRLLGREGDAWDTGCFVMDGDYVLRPGDAVTLYASRPAEGTNTEEWRDKLIDYAKIELNARYCSFYEDCWWADPAAAPPPP